MDFVDIKDLSKSLSGKSILNNIDLKIPSSSVFVLLGLNGEGKTTLMKILLGLLKADSGKIKIENGNIGFLIESPTFYENLTCYDNLKHNAILKNVNNRDIIDTLKLVGLDYKLKTKIKNYSIGMRQRLGLARAIINKPKFLILDEPMNGLDPVGVKTFSNIITDLNQKYNTTVLISSHVINQVESMATDYAILNNKTIQVQFNKSQANEISKCIKMIFINESELLRFIKIHNLIENSVKFNIDGTCLEIICYNNHSFMEIYETICNNIKLHKIMLTAKPMIERLPLENYFIKLIEGEEVNEYDKSNKI